MNATREKSGRTPQGVRGLKPLRYECYPGKIGRTPQGVRGLKPLILPIRNVSAVSHSARSAWIETFLFISYCLSIVVALRKECVD